jgi:hypothetical protein
MNALGGHSQALVSLMHDATSSHSNIQIKQGVLAIKERFILHSALCQRLRKLRQAGVVTSRSDNAEHASGQGRPASRRFLIVPSSRVNSLLEPS